METYSKEQLDKLFKMQLMLNDTFMALIKSCQRSIETNTHKIDGAIEDLWEMDNENEIPGILSGTDRFKL